MADHADIDHTGVTGVGGDITTDDAWAAKGDLIVGTGANTAAILTAGTNGHVLTADSAEATGMKFAAAAGGSGTTNHAICQGRLTLETSVAISTSDQSAKTTLYFTPFHGNLVGTYTDSAWQLQTFTEKSLSLAGYTADKNYDIWIEDSDLSLSSTVWTDNTNRATALASQDGVYVKTGDVSKRYLGTIRINASGGQCEDTLSKRFVWNAYNRVPRAMQVIEATLSWTYATATWRQANGATGNQLSFVRGLAEDSAEAALLVRTGHDGASDAGSVAIGLSSTTSPSGVWCDIGFGPAGAYSLPHTAMWRGVPGIGYRYLAWLEYARASTVTYYGTVANQAASGITGTVQA